MGIYSVSPRPTGKPQAIVSQGIRSCRAGGNGANFSPRVNDTRRLNPLRDGLDRQIRGPSSVLINARDKAAGALAVVAIGLAEGALEQGFFGASSQVSSEQHEGEGDPFDERGNPEGGAGGEEVEAGIQRMANEAERTAGGQLVAGGDFGAVPPGSKGDAGPAHEGTAGQNDDAAEDALQGHQARHA